MFVLFAGSTSKQICVLMPWYHNVTHMTNFTTKLLKILGTTYVRTRNKVRFCALSNKSKTLVCDILDQLHYFQFMTTKSNNKKVLLHDRKRRTVRGVACPVGEGALPLSCSGVPPVLFRGWEGWVLLFCPGYTPIRTRDRTWNTTSDTTREYPSLPGRTRDRTRGYPPGRTRDRTLHRIWDRTRGYLCLWGQTHTCENIASRRTPYVGGKNINTSYCLRHQPLFN